MKSKGWTRPPPMWSDCAASCVLAEYQDLCDKLAALGYKIEGSHTVAELSDIYSQFENQE